MSVSPFLKEPEKVLAALKEQGVSASANTVSVLTTHHHGDHAGGNVEMAKRLPGLTVLGGKGDNVAAATSTVGEGDTFKIGSLSVRVLQTPCHTLGHVLYFVTDAAGGQPALFSGDTLFNGGCGRFFESVTYQRYEHGGIESEGDAAQMYDALCKKVWALPDATRVYSGHEYTVSNLLFAAEVEPENKDVAEQLAWAKQQRDKGLPTVGTTLAVEKKINPFLRVATESVAKFLGVSASDPIQVMAELRSRKDNWGVGSKAAGRL